MHSNYMEMQVIFFINFNESKKPLYACKVTHGISESPIDFQWGSRKYPVYFDRYAIGKLLGMFGNMTIKVIG